MKRITKIEGNTAFLNAVRKTRVAAYCRVSTGSDEQLLSLETQKDHYERYIKAHPDWEYAGLYYDQGITGTKKDKRPALMQMVADCEDGRIDGLLQNLSAVSAVILPIALNWCESCSAWVFPSTLRRKIWTRVPWRAN